MGLLDSAREGIDALWSNLENAIRLHYTNHAECLEDGRVAAYDTLQSLRAATRELDDVYRLALRAP